MRFFVIIGPGWAGYFRCVKSSVHKTPKAMKAFNSMKWGALFVLGVTASSAHAQYFERIFNGPNLGADTAMGLARANDGGFYIVGSTPFGNFNDQYAIRTNSNGVQQWAANWGNSFGDEYFREVQTFTAGGFVATGNDRTTRADGANAVQWSNMDLLPGSGMAKAESVKSLNSGSQFISCGTWVNGTDRQATLVLRNALGDTIWTRKFGSPTTDETATSVVQTANGFAFIGLRNGIVALTLTDPNGIQTSVVNYTYVQVGGAGSYLGPFSLQNTADGGFIFVGSNAGNMRVVKTDASGTMQWVYDPQGGATGHFGAVKQLTDGSYIFTTGLRQTWDTEYRLCIQKLSATGVVQQSQVFQTGHSSMGTDIIQTPNGFAACGIIIPYPGAQPDFYLVHTDPNLFVNNSPCQLFGAHNFSQGSCGGTLVYTSNGGVGSFYVSLNNEVLASTPAGSLPISPGGYSFMITLISSDGCIDSYEDSVFVNGAYTVDAGTYSIACQTSQTMSSVVTPSGQYTYSWEPAYLFDNPTAANPQVAANVIDVLATLTVTDGSGCTVSDTVTVTHVEAITDIYDLCSGPVTLDFGAGAFTYNWQYFTPASGGPTQPINQNTQTYTATQPGTYMGYAGYPYCGAITSVVTVNACAQSCWNEFTYTITDQGCYSEGCFVSTGSPTIQSYQWVVDGQVVSFDPNPCIDFFAGGHVVTLITVDDQGCTAQTTHSVFVTNGLFGVMADTVTACQSAANLFINVGGGSGNYSYEWSPANGLSATNLPSVQATQVHQQWYTVTVTDNVSGCIWVDNVLASSYVGLLEDTVYLCTDSVLLDMGPGATFYNWGSISNNYWSQTAYVSQVGQYTVYAIYPNGCTAITNVLHVLPCTTNCTTDILSTQFSANCQTTVCVSPNGPPGIVSSSWVFGDGATSNLIQDCHTYSTGGIYTILGTFTYADGCTTQAYEIVNIPSAFTANIAQDTIACSGQLFGLGMNPVGGSGNFAYSWQPQGLMTSPNQATTSLNQPLTAPMWVYCTVTDNVTGCAVMDSVLIYPNLAQSQTLSQCDAPHVLSVNPGSMVYNWTFTDLGGGSFNWGANTNTTTAFYAGTYTCMTYYSGCDQVIHTFVVDTCLNDDVWPGDANSDNIVSNTDALWVGIAFNQNGPVRPGATLNWVGQPCADWAFDFAAIGENLKHADCNGNGTVNFADTVAIAQNYNLTHNKTEALMGGNGPKLWVQAVQDTVGLEQGIDYTVYLAEASNPVDSIHGLAFTLTFDAWLAQLQGLRLQHTGNVLGAVGTNALSFQKTFFIDGAIDVAISRTTGVNFNGFGPVATGRIVTTDNLSGIHEMRIGVSNVTAVSALGYAIEMSTQADSVVIDPTKTGINDTDAEGQMVLWPNPATTEVVLTWPTAALRQIAITDALGRTKRVVSTTATRTTINVQGFASGLYHVQVVAGSGSVRYIPLVVE